MTQYPYQETLTDKVAGKTEINGLYIAWHQGYEAHKLDLMTKANYIKLYVHEFIAEAKQISELKRELKKQRSELEQKNSAV
jgi:hypothetical protein